jgi:hypothetical protein
MNLSYHPLTIGQNNWESSATQKANLGSRGITQDGRVFRYALAGAADLVAGNVIQSPAIIANHLAMTPSAQGIGTFSITATSGATAGAANLYAEGLIDVDTTPGNGYAYGVKDHLAIGSASLFTVNLFTDDPLQVALTSSSRVGLIQNIYSGVIQSPVTTATGVIVGVAPYIIKATQYGWIQTAGLASVLVNGTPALGSTVIGTSGTTAGAVDIATATTILTGQQIGIMAQLGVSGKNNWVLLTVGE